MILGLEIDYSCFWTGRYREQWCSSVAGQRWGLSLFQNQGAMIHRQIRREIRLTQFWAMLC
jgi:hypothetical protein